jgi:hypothetical protein
MPARTGSGSVGQAAITAAQHGRDLGNDEVHRGGRTVERRRPIVGR